jgi:tetratricopeptide (TPR) repeat protein
MTNGPKRQGHGAETWRTQSYLIGHPLAQRERYDEALAIYRTVIQREPEDILAHLLAGMALLNLERDAEARTYFERALALADQALQQDAGDQCARVFFADALWMLDRNDEALAAYNEAIRRAPADPEAYVNKGHALFVLSRYVDAQALFEQAQRLHPDAADILYRLNGVYWDVWKYPEALRLIEQAIALDPTQPRFYWSLASTLSYMVGREAEAREAGAKYQRMLNEDA